MKVWVHAPKLPGRRARPIAILNALRCRAEPQVLAAIVECISVDVVNDLAGPRPDYQAVQERLAMLLTARGVEHASSFIRRKPFESDQAIVIRVVHDGGEAPGESY